jgi:hypothetical protein
MAVIKVAANPAGMGATREVAERNIRRLDD